MTYSGKQLIPFEDSCQRDVIHDKLEAMGFRILINKQQLGQHSSIDKAYKRVTQPYIFHCEDDWQFYGEPDFGFAKTVLDKQKALSFKFRKLNDRASDNHPNRKGDTSRYQTEYIDNKAYLAIAKEYYHTKPGLCFTPNLLRKELYDMLAPYGNYSIENKITIASFEKTGLTEARQIDGCCIHIGWNRHAQDPYQLPHAYNLFQRLR